MYKLNADKFTDAELKFKYYGDDLILQISYFWESKSFVEDSQSQFSIQSPKVFSEELLSSQLRRQS